MISVRQIQDACCKHFGMTRDQLLQIDRSFHLSHPRQIAMYLAREITGLGWMPLGREFCRDHTTILHGYRSATKLKDKEPWDLAIAAIRLNLGFQVETSLYERLMRVRWAQSVPREFGPGAYTGESQIRAAE